MLMTTSSQIYNMINEAKNKTLNPNLWDGDELKPEVKETLLKIANIFIDKLKEDDIPLDVEDIIIVGSSANYNYTPYSDIDLHIIADLSQFKGREKELAEKLYLAQKSIFNDKYTPTIKGTEVEIYVEPNEDINQNDIPDEIEGDTDMINESSYGGRRFCDRAIHALLTLRGNPNYKNTPIWKQFVTDENMDETTVEDAINTYKAMRRNYETFYESKSRVKVR